MKQCRKGCDMLWFWPVWKQNENHVSTSHMLLRRSWDTEHSQFMNYLSGRWPSLNGLRYHQLLMPWEVVSWRVFEASQPDADANWEMTVRSLHHKKRISPSPDTWQTFASHQRILSRRKRWKRRRVMLGCFWFLFSSRLIFFNKQEHWGLVGSGNGAWSIGWTCQNMQRYFCSFSRVRLSFTVFLHVLCICLYVFDCFCMFLHWHVPPFILILNTSQY